MSRSFGGTSLTMRPSMRSSPLVTDSSPATMRNRVDLPHPEGPTRITNSPSSTLIETPWMTSKAPKLLRTLETSTEAMGVHPAKVGAAWRRDFMARSGPKILEARNDTNYVDGASSHHLVSQCGFAAKQAFDVVDQNIN